MGITDVISGDKPIKFEIGVDLKSTSILAVTIFFVIVIAGIIIKKS